MDNYPPHVKSGMRILVGLLIGVAVFLAGVYVGYENRPAMAKVTNLVGKEEPQTIEGDFEPFWKAWQIVSEKLPEADKTAAQERIYGAIKGMLASFGDPYTTFFPPAENKYFESEIAGEFNGIGVEIGLKDDILTVIAPLKDTPADRAGLEPGDKIIKIGDTITSDISIDKAIEIIRGEAGTSVSLTIFREGFAEPKVFTMNRERIVLPTVDTEIREDQKVFIIHLYNFSAQSTARFRQALAEFVASGYTNLIVDLRDNPGGYLDAAVNISSLFLPEGKVVVKEIGKSPNDIVVHESTGMRIFPRDAKLVILVNKGSASASEILAGALSEHGIGTLAGDQTFGKGSVQELVKVTKDTSLKVTVAKWYTPNGVSISESGLTPKVKIPNDTTDNDVDDELEAAIKLFKSL